MANQIGHFFASQVKAEDPRKAVTGIAEHLRKFWDPSMRAAIIAHVENGGEGLDPLPRAAVERLAADQGAAPPPPSLR